MAITVGSIVQWKLFQSLLNQQVLNVGYWLVGSMSEPTVSLANMAQSAYELYTSTLDDLVSTMLIFERMELYEVNGLDFDIYSPPVPETGTIGGDVLPPQDCVTIQLVRQTRATRHGYKRLAGIAEQVVQNGQLTSAAYPNYVAGAQILWGQTTTLTNAASPSLQLGLDNIIWGGNDPAFPLGRYSPIADVSVDPWIRTQNTRKVGRGA